jgi:glutathione S-transferase
VLQLVIANKNYSSWSMRPWVLMRQAGIPFKEVMLPFDDFEPASPFKQGVLALSPAGKVPVLVDGGQAVWDSLAIAETLAERFADKQLWPADPAARARARSICAEMHAGFTGLRMHCPMNIEAALPEIGALVWRDKPGVRTDVARIQAMWEELLAQHGGPMLFGNFSIADAYYAPVCMRLRSYALPVSHAVQAYIDRITALPAVAEWIAGALAEKRFVVEDEPYRLHASPIRAEAWTSAHAPQHGPAPD